jgi:hypothetical protein
MGIMIKLKQYKILPRTAFILFLVATYEVVDWFMHLDDPTNAQAGFASMIVASAVGFFKFFMEGSEGKD